LSLDPPSVYFASLYEVLWGAFLIALTMALHAIGVLTTLRAGGALRRWRPMSSMFRTGMRTLVAGTLILVFFHLAEVMLWAAFYWIRGAFPNLSMAYFYALMQYTTVGSDYHLPEDLRLLAGINAMAGLLTVAWSTSVLFLLARVFQDIAIRQDGPPEP
jgi:hypothetical protein